MVKSPEEMQVISEDEYLDLVDRHLDRNLRDDANGAQRESVTHGTDSILQIVAGPGSGKTTVLVLRALRHMFVEDVLPEHILITTFTRKAAQELRTRWLDWGTSLHSAISEQQSVEHIDINRCRIDTLDSTVHDVLTEFRAAGALAPALADTAASLLRLKREVFQATYWPNKQVMDELLSRYTFEERTPSNQAEALGTTKRLLERLIQDQVDTAQYAQSGGAEQLAVDMLQSYRQVCIESNVFDFATLEEHFLDCLTDGQLDEWTKELRVLLIDEYQDTNPLQEAIYFTLLGMDRIFASIVGDDDQAMYRFRGGSVELFTEFPDRCLRATGRDTTRVDMVRNFRSHPEITDFFNRHISSDPGFQGARINPPKPLVVPARPSANVPVLGMFRPDEATLANDLATFLRNLADRNQISVGDGQEIHLGSSGAIGDTVFLSHSVDEASYNRYNRSHDRRFPGLLRASLEDLDLKVFNPRGQSLRAIPDVQKLLGLLLLSIDPDSAMVSNVKPTREAEYFLGQWRDIAQTFLDENPIPNDGRGLPGFILDWQKVASGQVVKDIPADWPVLELIFKLISWIPGFQNESEHQVWLEAVTRIISSATMASPYGMQLLQNIRGKDHDFHVERSRESLIRDALVPIAENEVDVDEDIMPSVPRDRLQFMTIHQSKGLEFPLVIVDVGSRFKSNHAKQRFLRFPEAISNVVQAEDDVEPYLATPIRGQRKGLDRTFDDLVRLYYVAYSRSQSVLMLVGNEAGLRYGPQGAIRNIALGWHRDENWPWRQPHTTKRPPVKVDPPFLEV